ncbi:MAG: DNA polymerase III subunit alpha [Acidobacteriota bacterium]
MAQFVHLHLHTQFSLLDGANRVDDVMDMAKSEGMPAVALTDHGNMFGAIEFYNSAKKRGIKPIIGMEAYTTPGNHRERDPRYKSSNHLVLLAKNETGYRNLLKLTSTSYLEGFYYKPRVDRQLLRDHSDGIICLSACLKGELNEAIRYNGLDEAESIANEYREIFGEENYFLEIQDHGILEQQQCAEAVRQLSKRTGIPYVATNDCHYLKKGDAEAHDALLCIGTQKAMADTDRMKYASDQFYMKTAEDMMRLFPHDGAAVERTVEVAEMCDLTIPSDTFHLPEFPVPPGETLDSYFEKVCRDGLEERFLELHKTPGSVLSKLGRSVYEERLRTEIGIIRTMGFPGYFLVVWDFMRYSREHRIPVGPGRGSAAGSLVSYALRITDVDPLQYDLLFERFLNPDRISMPDIDIDFCMRRRGEVIDYVTEKYGKDKVAQIITFGTLAAKAVIRDVGRVMGVPYTKVDRIAKLVPDMTKSLAAAAEEVEPLKQQVREDSEVRRIVEIGSRIEGLTRHASVHAAGVVITPRPTQELVPLYRVKKGDTETIMTQWDKDVVEDLGLLKMDFLGLRTLTVIDDATKILAHQGIELDLDHLALDDEETYRLFCEGRTSGVFQFESSGMRDLLRRAKPSRFEDLAAFNALYRPGALSVGMVDEYILRKLGKRKVTYLLPEVQPLLEETYGVIVYQEQVMLIAVEVAGFTMAEADILRKAMGKKKIEMMEEQKQKFLAGAERLGRDVEACSQLWDYIEPFAGYGFNKSHSVAYALVAYRTAYLKAHYPVAFMAAMLNSEMSSADGVAKYIVECGEMGIEVLPPEINRSDWWFTVEGDNVRFGLGGIKGIGEGAVDAMLEARKAKGRFDSFGHFLSHVDFTALNRRVLECLVDSGSFDDLHDNRRALHLVMDRTIDWARGQHQDRASGQVSLFGGSMADTGPRPDPQAPAWPERERLKREKLTLGLYLTGNPLSEYTKELGRFSLLSIAEIKEGSIDGSVQVGGLVTRLRKMKIKTGKNAGKMMGRFVLEDLTGSVPVAVFAKQLAQFGFLLEDERVVVVQGQARDRGGDIEMTVEEIRGVELESERLVSVDVRVPGRCATETLLKLRDVLIEHPGRVPVCLRLWLPDLNRTVEVEPRKGMTVSYSADLKDEVEALLGPGSIEARRAGDLVEARRVFGG